MKRALFVALGLLLLTFSSSGVRIASAGVSLSAPAYTNCSSGCKAKNEWGGGTVGVSTRLDLTGYGADHCSSPYCSFIEKGTWIKYSGDGSYVGAMIETVPTNDDQWYWKKYTPAGGLVNYYIGEFSNWNGPQCNGDNLYNYDAELTINWDSYYSQQTVNISYPDITDCIVLGSQHTGVAIRVLDTIQIGERIFATAGHAEAQIYPLTMHSNLWELGTDYSWHFQYVDGTMSNQASDWITHYWGTPPHLSSDGGDYHASCSCP